MSRSHFTNTTSGYTRLKRFNRDNTPKIFVHNVHKNKQISDSKHRQWHRLAITVALQASSIQEGGGGVGADHAGNARRRVPVNQRRCG